jgi:glycosyltransferase involved in cell wall biosynthesis
VTRGVAPAKVNIVTLTYNHEDYVAEAVESVLEQQCDFPVVHIIADDASTDSTPRILREYADRHPDRIRLILRQTNVGAQQNGADALARCTAQYVALLDGDDYWTDPGKLRKQVAFMDSHPDCSLCFHDAAAIDPDGRPQASSPPATTKERLEIEDLLKENFISACTVMYRWGLVGSLPAWWADTWIGDWPLHVLHAQYGWIGHIPEVMAAYRVHPGGLWSGRSAAARAEQYLATLRLLDETLGFRYHQVVEQTEFGGRYHLLAERYHLLAERCLSSAGGESVDWAESRSDAAYLVRHLRDRGGLSLTKVAVLLVQAAVPPLNRPIEAFKAFMRLRRRAG